jgi:hypothetical protein
MVNLTAVPVERVAEIQKLNRNGEKPFKLIENDHQVTAANDFENNVGKESLTRFEVKKNNHGGRRNKRRQGRNERKN